MKDFTHTSFFKCRLAIRDLMTKDLLSLTPSCRLREAACSLLSSGRDSLPVVDENGRVVGVLSKDKVLRELLLGTYDGEEEVGSVMDRRPTVFCQDAPFGEVLYHVRPEHITSFPVVDERGVLVGVLTPATIFLAAQEQIRDHLRRVILVLNSTRNGFVMVDREGIVFCFNPAAEKLLGRQAHEVVGKHIEELTGETWIMEVLRTGKPQAHRRMVLGNGHVVIASVDLVRHNGDVLGLVVVFQDITELESISQELEQVRRLKTLLEAVVENPYEGIVVIDDRGQVVMANRAYCQVAGCEREEILGKHIREVDPDSILPRVLCTGQAEMGDWWKINGQTVLGLQVPMVEDGRVVGAIGKILFRDLGAARIFAEKLKKLENEVEYYREELRRADRREVTLDDIIGSSKSMQKIKCVAAKAARSTSTVLLEGESGTGKELFARAIHNLSARRRGPFVEVNCAAIPETLLESELFGYAEGAFTGAKRGGKPGKFELAHRGTIFLDEIGDMPYPMQAKLLRVLQEFTVERVGGVEPIKVDVRVIAASNQDLKKLVQEGKFREDLYYRLNVLTIKIPPLRERKDDIPELVDHILYRLNRKLGSRVRGVEPRVMEALQSYPWPGNVRELENVLESLVNLAEGEVITLREIPPDLRRSRPEKGGFQAGTFSRIMQETEKELIMNALKLAGGNKARAARALNIHRSVLYRKLEKYQLEEF